jgi:Zn-dependent protease with chaperone function
VTERPRLVFGALLVLAAVAAAALLGALVEVGLQGFAGVAAVSAGLVSACVLFAIELRRLPPALVFVAAVAIASAAAMLHGLWCIWREQRLIRALPLVPLAESAYRAALRVPEGADVHVLPSRRRGAFCAGLRRPRIVVTTALLDALDPEERQAVVVHEHSHARGRGPLKLAVALLAARSLFWVPALRDLVDRYVLLSEIAADRVAVAATTPSALAGALSQVLAAPAIAGTVGLADHAAARIDRLFDARAELPRLLAPVRAAATGVALATFAALVYSAPRLSTRESGQLHAMSVHLLAHHVPARLAGFAATVLLGTIAYAAARRLAAHRH